MVDALPPAAAPETAGPEAVTAAVPPPRRPLERAGRAEWTPEDGRDSHDARTRHWYENELGWPTVPGSPVRLAVGVRFDVLDVPAEAGRAALRRLAPGSPVALRGERMRLLVAAGSAEELPGLLEWLDWGGLALDLAAMGAGDVMTAPPPPRRTASPGPAIPGARVDPVGAVGHAGPAGAGGLGCSGGAGGPGGAVGFGGSQGAAVWVRPPEPGCEVEASLPTLSALGGDGSAPDLVRLVDTVAAQCHRVRLRRACTRPPAWYS
ncbi:SCO3374 family protein [Streptomyces sp. DH24]|uniref:SCO3374 family protein n=1 Tax=Streptomyces sp. DH24 TaxID=3040123 RepID=UPI002441F273|nr:SCO3374 family protein [Streptomyces sp. DH24]MDG9720755.1 SCO3374 family protein [Streptomyces sp. DH24]